MFLAWFWDFKLSGSTYIGGNSRTEGAAGTGGEKWTFFFGLVALGKGVGWPEIGGGGAGGFKVKGLGTGGNGAGGFGDNRGLPLQGGVWVVTGNSESTGFSRSTETESVLEPIWREKYLGERETTK